MDAVSPRRAALAVVAAYAVWRFLRFRAWQKKMAKLLPGPDVSLFTGNLPEMISYGGFTQEMFEGDCLVGMARGPWKLRIDAHPLYRI